MNVEFLQSVQTIMIKIFLPCMVVKGVVVFNQPQTFKIYLRVYNQEK